MFTGKPTFINSRSQRKAILQYDEDVLLMLDDYRQDVSDMYEWVFPDELIDVPLDYPEECLFWTGTLGICPYESGRYRLSMGVGVRYDAYRRAILWQPTTIDPESTVHSGKRYPVHKFPLLELPQIPAVTVKEYVKARYSSIMSAGQNTIAMRQPVMIRGQAGVGVKYAVDMIKGGESYIPVVADDNGITREIEVLDMGAQNFLDPLTGFIDATDGWISKNLGIAAASTQKESGVSIEEVTATDLRTKSRRLRGLRLRQDWCAKVKETLNISIEVWINDEYDPPNFRDGVSDGVDSDIRDNTVPPDETGAEKLEE